MAESTCSKSAMERLEEALAKLASNVTKKLDDFLLRVASLETNTHHSPSLSSSSAIPTPNPQTLSQPKMKLNLPQFDGSNPSG